jgi:transcriptional regulator with XRE-family HTH domain
VSRRPVAIKKSFVSTVRGKSLREIIRNCREELGMKQTELAEKLGYDSAQFLSNVERGVAPMPRFWLNRLAIIFKLNREDLKELYDYELDRKDKRMKARR